MRSLTLTRGVALGGALTLLCAHAATPRRPQRREHAAAPDHQRHGPRRRRGGGSSILRTIIALLVVIVIIYAVARHPASVQGPGRGPRQRQRAAQIATLPLGPNRSVALVRAGRDIVLVGVAEQGITALKTYTEAEAIANGIEIPQDMATTWTRPSARWTGSWKACAG